MHTERAYCFKKSSEIPQKIIDSFVKYITTELVQQLPVTENFYNLLDLVLEENEFIMSSYIWYRNGRVHKVARTLQSDSKITQRN